MKLIFKPAPNYRSADRTQRIMFELTIGLLIVLCFSLYNASVVSMDNAVHIVMMVIASLITAFATEIAYALLKKEHPVKFIMSSFPWVPSLILVLISPTNISVYAIIVCTFIAIAFGKLVFGGFGNNIFNPAAVGRAVLAASFMGSVSVDVISSATPTSSMAALGWVTTTEGFNAFVSQFSGLSNMFVGVYPGAVGETSSLLIMLVGIFLAVRRVIDWRVPVIFITTLFAGASAIAIMHDMGVWYPVFHVLTGGAMFGAVFMMTDPVTNPTTVTGRIIFAMGCAFITLLIRVKGNLPEGVLFSILIMNMLTPMIDRMLEGQQFRRVMKNALSIVVVFVLGLATVVGVSTALEPVGDGYEPGPKVSLEEDFSKNDTYIYETDGDTYLVKSVGFQGDNKYAVTITDGSITKVSFEEYNDTPGYGDKADNQTYLSIFNNLDLADLSGEVDTVSGATVTSKSLIAAVLEAVRASKQERE